MNIAIQAVVIFALALPGILFLRAKSLAGRFRSSRAIGEELAEGFVAAIVAHSVWVPVANLALSWFGLRIALDTVAQLLVGKYGPGDAGLDTAVGRAVNYLPLVTTYFLSLYGAAWALGTLLRHWQEGKYRSSELVGLFGNDEPNARRYAEWTAVLQLDTKLKSGEEFVCVLSAVVQMGDAYLFVGRLEDVHWDDEGNPERFVLSSVLRRRLEDDGPGRIAIPAGGEATGGTVTELLASGLGPVQPSDADVNVVPGSWLQVLASSFRPKTPDPMERFYEILGDTFLLHRSEATTINLHFSIQEVTSG